MIQSWLSQSFTLDLFSDASTIIPAAVPPD